MVHTLAGLTFPIRIVESFFDTQSTHNRQKTTEPYKLFHSVGLSALNGSGKTSPVAACSVMLPHLERRDYRKIPAQSIILMLCDEKTKPCIGGGVREQGTDRHNLVLKAVPESRPSNRVPADGPPAVQVASPVERR
jgi:hypothetical protein